MRLRVLGLLACIVGTLGALGVSILLILCLPLRGLRVSCICLCLRVGPCEFGLGRRLGGGKSLPLGLRQALKLPGHDLGEIQPQAGTRGKTHPSRSPCGQGGRG